jgi:ribosome recycling factor
MHAWTAPLHLKICDNIETPEETHMDAVKNDAEDRMEKALATLVRDFGKLRTGRASTSLVEGIKVEYYGAPTPISQIASVATPDSRTITIQPWDRGSFALVEKAILKSDLGLTPINDGKIIRIGIPPLTEERRKDLVKVARKYSEETKVAVRNIRRDANDRLKKLEKDKSHSEDEIKKMQDVIQKLTDAYVAKVDQKCQAKEKEIMEL